MTTNHAERQLTDTLLERPWLVQVGGRQLSLRAPSLGLSLLALGALQASGWQHRGGHSLEEYATAFAMASPLAAARFIAYHCAHTRDEAERADFIEDIASDLSKQLTTSDLSTLVLMLLKRDDVECLISGLGIAQDIEARAKALQERGADGWLSFGGRSIYGALIDPIAERYGWTLDYILWGISYANLRLLLADQPTSIYQGVNAKSESRVIQADDLERQAEIDLLVAG